MTPKTSSLFLTTIYISSLAQPGNSFFPTLAFDSIFNPISGLNPARVTMVRIMDVINYLPVHKDFGLSMAGVITSMRLISSNPGVSDAE